MERLVVPCLDADGSFINWWMEMIVPRIGVARFVEILATSASDRAGDLSKVLYHLPHLVDGSNEDEVASLRTLRRLAPAA